MKPLYVMAVTFWAAGVFLFICLPLIDLLFGMPVINFIAAEGFCLIPILLGHLCLALGRAR